MADYEADRIETAKTLREEGGPWVYRGVTLVPDGAGGEVIDPEAPPAPVTVYAVEFANSTTTRAGTDLKIGQRRLLLAAETDAGEPFALSLDGTLEPQGGAPLRILDVGPFRPDGQVTIFYEPVLGLL